MTFNIAQWRAWAPGLSSAHDWQRWSTLTTPQPPSPDIDAAPDVSFLPAMQRRRLSRMARMAFHVGWPLAEGSSDLPFVFVSRHGETPRTFDILSDLAAEQPLSPTQFSLSVHNAVIGLWSIMRGSTSEMTALAAAGDGLEHGVMEAAALLDEGAPAVLLVVAEDLPPAAYAPWVDDVPFPYAVGLLLTPGTEWSLTLAQRAEPPRIEASAEQGWPHALDLLRTLLAQRSTCQHFWKSRAWTWQRSH
ncbi:beta-ketoacyl synthase chain length factor [Pseudomonas sp. UBA4194]|uniref:beta-ketoacyl synthase chain length factor n=1 Tax=Pseudomonas sp. UBA4194 TaxID=1947317 RepID=UPI0025F445D5|nr:beta-ketoacyl synthase chain length factor [Pseudomonas sp. UBA4194]